MIVIPMIDQGNHFREAGYTTPQFMLTWRRKSLFFHALDSFRSHFATEKFLIVLQDREDALSFVERELPLLGIPRNRITVVTLENPANGPAKTVADGLRKAQVPPNAPLTIFNPDTYRGDFVYPTLPNSSLSGIDGYLEVFSEDGEDRTFVRSAPDQVNERRDAEVSKQTRISDLRCTGLHHFRSCEFYLELYAEVERLQPNESRGGEHHVASLYDRATRRGADIRHVRILSDDVKFFGTPAAYGQRLRETPSDKPLAFCISGQIRSDRQHLEAIADLAREHEADVYISTWRKRGRLTNLFNVTRLFPMPKRNMMRLFGRVATRLLPMENMDKIMSHDTARLLATAALEDCGAELKEIFPDAVIDIEENDALALAFNTSQVAKPRFGDVNSLYMSYKIWRCNRLKRAGEAARGRKYEGVARFRSDVIPSLAVFKATKMQSGTVVLNDRRRSKYAFDDLFWLCDSQTDDQLSNFFGKVVSTPGKNWGGVHKELEDWVRQLSLTVMWDRLKVGPFESSSAKDQTFACSVVCDALRSGQYTVSTDLTREDAKILADIIECSRCPSKVGLTIDRLRSMYSPDRALVVVRGILISALSISEPPCGNPGSHRHCADLILLTMTAELGWREIRLQGVETAMLQEVRTFLAPFRNANRNDEPFLRGMPDTRQSHDLWKEVGNLLQATPNATEADSPLDELVWTVHRDLLARLGEERFMTIARSIQDRA